MNYLYQHVSFREIDREESTNLPLPRLMALSQA